MSTTRRKRDSTSDKASEESVDTTEPPSKKPKTDLPHFRFADPDCKSNFTLYTFLTIVIHLIYS